MININIPINIKIDIIKYIIQLISKWKQNNKELENKMINFLNEVTNLHYIFIENYTNINVSEELKKKYKFIPKKELENYIKELEKKQKDEGSESFINLFQQVRLYNTLYYYEELRKELSDKKFSNKKLKELKNWFEQSGYYIYLRKDVFPMYSKNETDFKHRQDYEKLVSDYNNFVEKSKCFLSKLK